MVRQERTENAVLASSTTGGPAPRARRTRQQLQSLLVEEGVALLLERGLEGGAAHITLNEVLERVEHRRGERVTRASVYSRIWDSQSEFQQDLLLGAASTFPSGETEPTRVAALHAIAAADTSTPAARAAALREVCRVAGDAHVGELGQSRAWQIWVGVWALTVSTPDDKDDLVLGPAIEVGHHRAVEALQKVLVEIIGLLRYQVRAPFQIEHFTMSVAALAEGLALRDRFGPAVSVVDDDVSFAASDQTRTRSLFSVGFDGLALHFLEPAD